MVLAAGGAVVLAAGGAAVLAAGGALGAGGARIPEEPPAPGPVALPPLPNGLNIK